jgi:two-component system, NarL family, response regulator LiaR
MTHRNKCILLVDDNAIVRNSLRQLFEGAGFVCSEAENGAKGLELAGRLHPSLIVLDFSMPVMSGLEAAPLFKKQFPEMPIIMFTMFANEAFAKVAVAAGVTEIIPKDQASHLLPRVASLLKLQGE